LFSLSALRVFSPSIPLFTLTATQHYAHFQQALQLKVSLASLHSFRGKGEEDSDSISIFSGRSWRAASDEGSMQRSLAIGKPRNRA
jgi:hypothetical protein